jgi:hypothetical protein
MESQGDARQSLESAVRGDKRTALEAMRDYIAHQLEANLCPVCLNSRLRTGDQASLLLRLRDVLNEIEALPSADGEVSSLDQLRARRAARQGTSAPEDPAQPRELGSKSAERRSGSRRPGGGRRPGS